MRKPMVEGQDTISSTHSWHTDGVADGHPPRQLIVDEKLQSPQHDTEGKLLHMTDNTVLNRPHGANVKIPPQHKGLTDSELRGVVMLEITRAPDWVIRLVAWVLSACGVGGPLRRGLVFPFPGIDHGGDSLNEVIRRVREKAHAAQPERSSLIVGVDQVNHVP